MIGSDGHKGFARRLLRPAAIGLCIALLGAAASLVPWMLELDENAGLDWLFGVRGPAPAPANVVVISIGTDSAEALGLPTALNEWPRSLHAELIEGLRHAGAAVVAFDILFDRERAAEHDTRLAAAIQEAGNVILLDRVRSDVISVSGAARRGEVVREVRVPPVEDLKRGALASAPFPLPVVPVRVNQFWVFGRGVGDVPTLPAVALQAYALPLYEELASLLAEARPLETARLPMTAAELRELRGLEEVVRDIRGLFRADAGLATELHERLQSRQGRAGEDDELLRALLAMYAGADSRYLHYYGPPRSVRTIPYHTALEAFSGGEELDLGGAVVFVGFSERRQPEQQDAFYSVYSQRSGLNLSGVEIAATALGNLLERRYVEPLSIPAQLGLVAAWGLVLGTAFAVLPALPSILLALAGAAVYMLVAAQQFRTAGLWMPLVVPLLVQLPGGLFAGLLWQYRRLQVQRQRIQRALGYYLPPAAVNRLAHESIGLDSGRQLVQGTCLVTDADHYTGLSETMGAEELGRLMNEYYGALVAAVSRHGGEVSDIGGDSMVAVWAVADYRRPATERACAAALLIQSEVARFNREHAPIELPTRIGLDCGEVLLGNIGAEQRFEYRAVGDIVNTASRLQGLNRQLGTRILASGRTLDALSGVVSRELGRFLLVGKRDPLVIHELLAMETQASAPARRLQGLFAAALECFRMQRWAAAERAFGDVLAAFPGDGPSRFYVDLCVRFGRDGPPADWQGAIRLTAK